jgi:hypothetical protein
LRGKAECARHQGAAIDQKRGRAGAEDSHVRILGLAFAQTMHGRQSFLVMVDTGCRDTPTRGKRNGC